MMFNQRAKLVVVATVFGLIGAGASYAFQAKPTDPKQAEKDKMHHGELPDVVKSAADKYFGASGYKHETVTDDGTTQFVCKGTKDGKETEAVFTESGDMIIVRKFMKQGELPAAALANFRSEYKDAKIQKVAEVDTHFYAITFEQGGNTQRVKTYPNGHIWRRSDVEDKK